MIRGYLLYIQEKLMFTLKPSQVQRHSLEI